MFGRKIIYTSRELDGLDTKLILDEVAKAYITHLQNRGEERRLYDIYRGKQDVLLRTKDVRPEICHKVVENRANELVTFWTGYVTGKPIQYVSTDTQQVDGIAALNRMMKYEGKPTKDKQLFEDMCICGTGYRMVLPDTGSVDEAPFELTTLSPLDTFVIYSNDISHKPEAGIAYYHKDVKDSEEEYNAYDNIVFTVYTASECWVIDGGALTTRTPHLLGGIPIIEYPLNQSRLGTFEIVMGILDAINDLDSNRLDSVEQFVQSMLVLYNTDLPEGQDARTIQKEGMIILPEAGDIKILAETLDQSNTQTLKQDLLTAFHEITGLPQTTTTAESSNNTAVMLKTGWQGAETRAEGYEAMFRASEQEMLKVVLKILRTIGGININLSDIDIKFTRRNYEDILSKSQTLVTMLTQDKIHPKSAFEVSGLFTDSEEAYRLGMEWYEAQKAAGVPDDDYVEDIEPMDEDIIVDEDFVNLAAGDDLR